MLNSIIRIAASVLGVTLLIAGCAKVLDSTQEPTQTIGFSAGSSLLRDDVISTKAYPGSFTSFGVFAFIQTPETNSGNWKKDIWTPNLMFNQEVSVSGATYNANGVADVSGATFSYSPTASWPATGNKASFWAYSPYDASASLVQRNKFTTYTAATKGIPDIRFTVSNGKTDLMVSAIVKDKTYENSPQGVVSFNFRHVLSWVDFVVQKLDDDNNAFTVNLTSISFENVYLTGIYRNNDNPTTTGYWAGWSGQLSSLQVFSGSQEVYPSAVALSNYSVMPIPQTLVGAEARMRVAYTLENQTEGISESNVYTFPITADWELGKHYTYTIQIRPGWPIKFTISWVDWGDAHTIDLAD